MAPSVRERLETYGPAVFIWAVVAFASFLKTGPGVMRGTLPGNDDYMRLVQVRDWLGGQAWSDPVQDRMFPPDPLISHWGRLSDVLIGGLIKVFTPFLGAAGAETAALLILPPALLLIAVLLVVRLATQLSKAPSARQNPQTLPCSPARFAGCRSGSVSKARHMWPPLASQFPSTGC